MYSLTFTYATTQNNIPHLWEVGTLITIPLGCKIDSPFPGLKPGAGKIDSPARG